MSEGRIMLDALHLDALHLDALHLEALHLDALHLDALLMYSTSINTPPGRQIATNHGRCPSLTPEPSPNHLPMSISSILLIYTCTRERERISSKKLKIKLE